jgi:hypothetical protein
VDTTHPKAYTKLIKEVLTHILNNLVVWNTTIKWMIVVNEDENKWSYEGL